MKCLYCKWKEVNGYDIRCEMCNDVVGEMEDCEDFEDDEDDR